MGIDRPVFYDAAKIAILPMGFCYPGTGTSGDLPPRPECAQHWRQPLLGFLPHIALTLAIGQYAHAWHLGKRQKGSLTADREELEGILAGYIGASPSQPAQQHVAQAQSVV